MATTSVVLDAVVDNLSTVFKEGPPEWDVRSHIWEGRAYDIIASQRMRIGDSPRTSPIAILRMGG